MLLSRLLPQQAHPKSSQFAAFRFHSRRLFSMILISDNFDSGNICLKNIKESPADVTTVDLHIKNEPFTGNEQKQHKQWFHFRASGVKGKACRYTISNAGDCSFPEAWPGYNTCYSYDRRDWLRVPTSYQEGNLSWNLTSEYDQVYFAYFAPFSNDRHLDLLAKCASSEVCSVRSLGQSLEGRDIDMVTLGSGPLKVWVIARQHPGEPMAEWWAEGYLLRLMDQDDAVVRKLLKEVTCYVIPNMNPDGAVRGHLRTNAAGSNLNREWASRGDYEAPTLARSPEVYHVLQALDAIGCDMFIDVHGDETLPYNFIAGSHGIPKWSPRLKSLEDNFLNTIMEINPDMQKEFGYGDDEVADLTICSNQVGERFDCLSFTLEMPFKDNAELPEPLREWSAARAMHLGASYVDAIAREAKHLRS